METSNTMKLSVKFEHDVKVNNSILKKVEVGVQETGKMNVDDIKDEDNNCQEDVMEQIHKQQCMASALRQNAQTIYIDMCPFREDLIDLLIEKNVLYKDEIPDLDDAKSDNEIDKARKLLKKIRGRSYHVMVTFRQCMERFSSHMVEMIDKSFEECKKEMKKTLTCSFCFLKETVDIKLVALVTWSSGKLSDSLYDYISECRAPSDKLWQMFVKECNSKDSETIKRIISNIRSDLDRRGHYRTLSAHIQKMCAFICECAYMESKFRKEICKRHHSHQDDRLCDNSSIFELQEEAGLQEALSSNELLLIDNILHRPRDMSRQCATI